MWVWVSVTGKKSPNVYKKWLKIDFTGKMKDLDNFNTLPKMWLFVQNNCCHRHRKVAQSWINRPIRSHWFEISIFTKLCTPNSHFIPVLNSHYIGYHTINWLVKTLRLGFSSEATPNKVEVLRAYVKWTVTILVYGMSLQTFNVDTI